MSGLALSSLILIGLIVPGLVFHYRYYQTIAQDWKFTGSVDTSFPRAIVFALLFAVPTHAVWVLVINSVPTDWGLPAVDFHVLLRLLQGASIEPGNAFHEQLNRSLLLYVAAYFLSQTFFGFLSGGWLAALAERFGWSKKVALSSATGIWHRLLRYMSDEEYGFPGLKEGDPPSGVIISVAITVGEKPYIYIGFLTDYWIDPGTRRLDRVLLRFPVRKPILDNGSAEPHEIVGEYLMVECANAETVDIDYFWLEPQDEEDERKPDAPAPVQA